VYARTRRVQVAPFIFQLKTGVIVKSNEEVAEKFWVPLSILESSEVNRTEVKVDEGKLNVEAYIYGGNTVWGLTFRIINTLLDRKETSTL
jgi:hypothetical protein